MATKKIEHTVELSAQDIGLNPLIFDKPFLNIDYLETREQLINISLKLSSNYIDNIIKKAEDSISEDIYERISFPIILVHANIEGERKGKLTGIIRPKLMTSLSTGHTKPIKEMPEFHFYLLKPENGNFAGRSSNTYENINCEGISCGIKQITQSEIKDIGNLFEITSKTPDLCSIYYRK